MVAEYRWAKVSRYLEVYADADHAGCHRTRKSTLGGVVLWGGKFVKGWSKTMDTLALSSGESELGALVKGCSEGLGVQALLLDLDVTVDLKILSDATAAIGMAKRL